MKICVLGLGYIGLPTALLLANAGNEVIGVDTNNKIIEKLNNGKIPFEEPGIKELLRNAMKNFAAKDEVEESDVFLIAVPTPLESSLKIADLKAVRSAAKMIRPHLQEGNLVILESTVPPGTSEKLLIPMLEKNRLGVGDFHLAYCPERAIPGKTIHEMTNNDRIIGGYDNKSAEMAKLLYASFVKGIFLKI